MRAGSPFQGLLARAWPLAPSDSGPGIWPEHGDGTTQNSLTVTTRTFECNHHPRTSVLGKQPALPSPCPRQLFCSDSPMHCRRALRLHTGPTQCERAHSTCCLHSFCPVLLAALRFSRTHRRSRGEPEGPWPPLATLLPGLYMRAQNNIYFHLKKQKQKRDLLP